jgi:putative transposase
MGGIARDRGFPSLAVGGVTDHVHPLISMPGTKTISECMRVLKGVSSKWVNDQFVPSRSFRWQDGYGAFSITQSQIERRSPTSVDRRNTIENAPSR